MATKLFIGRMSFKTTEDDLRAMFAAVGEVTDVKIPTDRETNRPRGFAFVEMANDDEAQKAIKELDGKELDGWNIVVNEAKPQEARGPRPGGDRGGDRGGFKRNQF